MNILNIYINAILSCEKYIITQISLLYWVHKNSSKKYRSENYLAMITVSCLACWPVQNNVLCQLFIRAHALNRLAIKIISSNNISSTAQNLSYSSTILTIFRNDHLEFFDIAKLSPSFSLAGKVYCPTVSSKCWPCKLTGV